MRREIMWSLVLASVVGLALAGTAAAADPTLAGWWKLDDGAGSTAADSSGNGNDGNLVGTTEWVEGIINGALHLDGATAHVEIPADPSLAVINKGDFSAMLWCRSDALDGANQYALQQGDLNGTGRSWLYFFSDNEIRTFVGGATTGSGFFVEAETWYHMAVVVTEQGGTDSIQLFVNGQPEGAAGALGMEDCEGAFFLGAHKNLAAGTRWTGILDDVRIYNRGLTAEEIQEAMRGIPPELASDPLPADSQTDVPRDGILAWTPGELAATHDVYLGTVLEDVNNASRNNPLNVLVSQGQADATYDAGRLEFGQTYYWRVDEVNAAPDNTIFKGPIWSFTVEPLGYPIVGILATSNGTNKDGEGPENVVNGSGLNADDQHSVEAADMWLADPPADEPLRIQFEFDHVHKLHEMLVWNYNVAFELMLGFGLKDVMVEYSADGVDWTALSDVVLAQATAQPDYVANTTVAFGGVAAQYVRLTVNSGHGMLGQFGLSEVRFTSIPVHAGEPQPADGATGASVTTTLGWKAGREAAAHDVSLGTDPNALVLIDTASDTTLDPGPLDLAATYYWRVDEINEAEALSVWEGDVWTFATEEFVVVDDFEGYDDDENTIFDTWLDGFVNETGSTVGYFEAPFAEQTIVHGGGQSMPLEYNNTGGVTVSEATRTFDTPQDWTQHGIKGLLIRFYGDPGNDSAQMYVKIDNEQVPYDGDAENLTRIPWQLWYVDLAGMNVSSVDELTIGIEGSGAGMIFIDDIALSPYERQQVTPVEPDAANLVAQFAFDGNTNDSTGAHPGTAVGSPPFVAGKIGQAISLNGTGDYVELTGYKGVLGANPITVATWVKTTNTETGAIIGWGPNVGGQRFGFRIDVGRLRHEHHGGNIQGDTVMNDGAWHHVALTVQANATVSHPEAILWLDGQDDTRPTTDPDPYDIVADLDVRIGSRPAGDDRFFMGEIDELYIYDRALSQAEIAYLAGRTQPFDVE